MSEANLQQQTHGPIAGTDYDSADEYVVIEQEEEADLEKNSTLPETVATNTNSTPSDVQSVAASVGTLDAVADIGNGLDGAKLSVSSVFPLNAMSGSNYSQNGFNSSIFGSFVMEDQLRDLVRSENEQNRLMLDSIKNEIGELTKQKSNNNELNALISQQKKSLGEALTKLNNSEKLSREKDERIVELEQKIQQLSEALDDSASKTTQLGEELANKDEIIKVLREEIDEQHRVHGTRVKVWRERIDSLEQMLISQQERAEADKWSQNGQMKEEGIKNREKQQSEKVLFICEKCLNAFPRYGYLYAHYSNCN
ncbi:hypothetical protein niasHS_003540 [Heterodera schachtii]|uniref:Uncharacterized protein n=1 Tax=Heterodera schachtii TaxID=97005 RepID=A0ABD2KGV3_HETSC